MIRGGRPRLECRDNENWNQNVNSISCGELRIETVASDLELSFKHKKKLFELKPKPCHKRDHTGLVDLICF